MSSNALVGEIYGNWDIFTFEDELEAIVLNVVGVFEHS